MSSEYDENRTDSMIERTIIVMLLCSERPQAAKLCCHLIDILPTVIRMLIFRMGIHKHQHVTPIPKWIKDFFDWTVTLLFWGRPLEMKI